MNLLQKPVMFYVLLVGVFLLAFNLRFYQLGQIPRGLYPDETAIGYNAYSILKTGRDEHGAFMPIYFQSFDDYKLPVYIYATAASIKFFGVTAFAVRLPSALFGFFAVIAFYFLVFELTKRKWLALLSSFFLALNPWHVFFSRTGYEVNLATSLMVFGTLFFIVGVNRKKSFLWFLLSVLSFLLAVYTYSVTRVVAPLILVGLCGLYLNQLKKMSKSNLIILVFLFVIGMVPFLITYFTLQSQPGFASQKDALIFGNAVKADILETRSYFIFLPHIVQQVLFNYWILVLFTYFKNLISFFSTNFFFITGSNHPSENIGGGLAMFYYFEFPLMIWGVYQGLKNRISFLYPFYLWFFVMFFAGSIVQVVPNGTRTYSVVIPLVVFSTYGMYALLDWLMHLKKSSIRNGILALCVIIMLYSYILYFLSYFIRYPIEYAKDWKSEDERLVAYIINNEKKYNKIIFDDSAGFIYTSLLFYSQYPPDYYQQHAIYKMNGLVLNLASVGKYELRKVNFDNEKIGPREIIITGSMSPTPHLEQVATFSYPTRPVVLYYNRKIGQYPVTDVAYEVFQSEGK